jgi:N-acetylmuramoyl-L-alanine amidase
MMCSNIDATLKHDPSKRKLPLRYFVLLALLCGGGCADFGGARVKDTTKTFTTVVIDAGHGGHDDGARSRWGGKEKNNTLDVALRLEPKIRAAGFKTVLTRTTDTFAELNERARISNRQDNAIFVSIHFNDSRKSAISGTEVYYKSSVSRPLAERVLAKVAAIPGDSARFVKTANFRVLKLNEYPAVLVECGYLSNRREGARCATPAHHERLAEAIASGLLEQCGKLTVPAVSGPVATAPAR